MESAEPPAYVVESSLLPALNIVETQLLKHEQAPTYISVRAGDRTTYRALLSWFSQGTLTLTSAAASEIAGALRRIARTLQGGECVLTVNELPPDFFRGALPRRRRPRDVVLSTAMRLYERVLPRGIA